MTSGTALREREKRTTKTSRRAKKTESTPSNLHASGSFLTPEGKRLPGLSDKDTIGYRIETLRLYLEQELGAENFISVYRTLQEEKDSEDESTQIVLEKPKEKFLPLIYQLIVCEDNYYRYDH